MKASGQGAKSFQRSWIETIAQGDVNGGVDRNRTFVLDRDTSG